MKSRIVRSSYALLIISSSSFLLACNSQPTHNASSGLCPQERTTEMAPAVNASQPNQLNLNASNLEAGEKLFQSSAEPLACAECHGEKGDGNGRMASMFQPAPRNFTCSENIAALFDGQIFWIIKNGSIGTSMPAFDKLTDDQIWQLTLYIRSLEAKPAKMEAKAAGQKQASQY